MHPGLMANLHIRFPAVLSIGCSEVFPLLYVILDQSQDLLQNIAVPQCHIIVKKNKKKKQTKKTDELVKYLPSTLVLVIGHSRHDTFIDMGTSFYMKCFVTDNLTGHNGRCLHPIK